jgi:hypothetical protein
MDIPEPLLKIVDEVAAGRFPSYALREVLGWFSPSRSLVPYYSRRGLKVALTVLQLDTRPRVGSASITSYVRFFSLKEPPLWTS